MARFTLRFFLVVTEQERDIIKEEAKRRGLDEDSSILREALRLYFEKYGTKLPPEAFAERKRGAKPKIDPLPEVSLQGV